MSLNASNRLPIRIMIVDDHPITGDGMAAKLEKEFSEFKVNFNLRSFEEAVASQINEDIEP